MVIWSLKTMFLNGITVKMAPKWGARDPQKTNSNTVFQGTPPFGRGSDPNFLNGGTINLHFGWFGIIFNKNNVCYNRNDQNFGRNTCFLKKWMVFDWKKPKMSHKKRFFSNLNVFWVEFYSKLIQIMKKLIFWPKHDSVGSKNCGHDQDFECNTANLYVLTPKSWSKSKILEKTNEKKKKKRKKRIRQANCPFGHSILAKHFFDLVKNHWYW